MSFFDAIKRFALVQSQSSPAQGQAQGVQQMTQTAPSMVAGADPSAWQAQNPYQGGLSAVGFPAIIQHLIQAGAMGRTQAQPQRLDMFRQSNNPSGGGYYG